MRKYFSQENVIYIVLMLLAIFLAISKYGTSSLVQTIAVFFCIIQIVINSSSIYAIVKRAVRNQELYYTQKQWVSLILTTGIVLLLFFAVLSDYFKSFVLTYSGIILIMLLLYDVGRKVLKKS